MYYPIQISIEYADCERVLKMNAYWKIDTDQQKQELLAHARNVALMALQQYDLAWKEIKFNKLSDAITFKIRTETEDCFLLRIHNKGRKKSEIYGEILLLNHLKSQNLTAPVGLKSRSGEYVLEFESSDREILYATLMNWIDGKVLSSTPTDIQVTNIGNLLAHLHNATGSFVAKQNQSFPKFGVESFCKNIKKLRQYHSLFMSEKGWEMYQSVANKIIIELENIEECPQEYGIIHGDFHMENIIFSEDKVFPIDFGRCGYGSFLYDIASNILGLDWRSRKKFVEAYADIRKLSVDYEQLLETMFIKVMIENYCHHCSNPFEIEGLIAEQPYAQAYIQAYLQRRSFLFKPIEL